jgi:hypothetical protein
VETVQLLGLLAAAAFAGSSTPRPASLVAMAASFAAGLAVFLALPAAAGLPIVVVLGVALALARPNWPLVPAVAAGSTAAACVSVLTTAGIPLAVGVAASIGVVALAAALAALRRGFAPAKLRDEALLLVGVLALLAVVGGEVAAGWRSATAFAATPIAGDAPSGGFGLVAVVVVAVVLGGGYGWWTRR